MREWAPAEWRREWTAARGPFALFVHTPLCGTCKAARRMLEVASAMLPDMPMSEANLNLMPDLAQAFRVESVPCLLIKRADGRVAKHYRFGSVQELLDRLKAADQTGRIKPI